MALYQIRQSNTTRPLLFLMVDSVNHISGKTGLSPTVTISKNGGSFVTPAGAVSEVANGWYKVAPNATDANTLGPLILHATATGADPSDTVYEVVAYDPDDSTRLGLTALPNAAAGSTGGLPTVDANNAVKLQSGTGANQISLSAGQVTVGSIAAGGITASSIAANAINANALATDAVNEIADGLLDRDMSAGTDSGSATVRTVRQALRALRNRFSRSGTTFYFYKEDDVTVSWQTTVETDTAAVPIVGSNPEGP